MSDELKQELIEFRVKKANEAFVMASMAAERELWNSVVSELYYACFYLVIAFFAKNDIKTSTHSGVKTVFGLHFIKTGLLDAKWGRLLSDLFGMRQDADYRDFKIFTKEEIMPLLNQVTEFRKEMQKLLSA